MKNATRMFVSTFGAIMALAGIEHGIGEILQGNTAPSGVMIQSWPESEFFRNLNGEPAMTIVPNLLVTGILAVLLSLALLVWSILFVQRKHGGWVMVILSLAMLLLGGGIFPPLFGSLIGIVATRIRAPYYSSQAAQMGRMAYLWPWFYITGILAWLLVTPVAYIFGDSYPALILVVLFIALSALVLTVVSGLQRDHQMHVRAG